MKRVWVLLICLGVAGPSFAQNTTPASAPSAGVASDVPAAWTLKDAGTASGKAGGAAMTVAENQADDTNAPDTNIPTKLQLDQIITQPIEANKKVIPQDSTRKSEELDTNPGSLTDYVEPTWENFLHAMIRANALDVMTDNVLLDDYAVVTECELYQTFFRDDFKWNDVRAIIRKSIRINAKNYPNAFRFDNKVQLDRYDFEKQTYLFTPSSQIKHANTFTTTINDTKPCVMSVQTTLPILFRVVINDPITIVGIPLSPKDAEALLHLIELSGNTDRFIYVRFKFRVASAASWAKIPASVHDPVAPYQQNKNDYFIFDSKLDSVDFFADPQYTLLVYSYKAQ